MLGGQQWSGEPETERGSFWRKSKVLEGATWKFGNVGEQYDSEQEIEKIKWNTDQCSAVAFLTSIRRSHPSGGGRRRQLVVSRK